jgi:hypothetical protein
MPHEVKILRRDIGDMKMMLDIFFDAYPESTTELAKTNSAPPPALAHIIRDAWTKGTKFTVTSKIFSTLRAFTALTIQKPIRGRREVLPPGSNTTSVRWRLFVERF